jgi:hypothetical protein
MIMGINKRMSMEFKDVEVLGKLKKSADEADFE